MMRFRWLIFLAGMLLIFSKTVIGQNSAPDSIDVGDPMISDATSVVVGLPYQSVEQVSVTTTLPDGQRVVVELRARRYRDASGKTRIEEFPMKEDGQSQDTPAGILIIDPAADVIHELQTATRTVYSVAISKLEAEAAPPALFRDPTQPINQPNRPGDVVDEYIAALRPPPAVAWGKGEEDLGTQTVAGLVAHGERETRITVTAPSSAKAIKSANDIKEDWRSSDLQITLLSKRSSSRYGEVDTRVISIDRHEPDPPLFEVPADYAAIQP
jgi:hypothetical protein